MYTTTVSPVRNQDDEPIIGTTPRIQVQAARYSLKKIPTVGRHADALADALAALDELWAVVSGETPPARRPAFRPLMEILGRTLDDDGPDFEETADDWSTLAATLPSLSGGSPEAYVPTPQDLADYAEWSDQLERKHRAEWMAHCEAIGEGIELMVNPYSEADAIAAGLAV